MPRTRLTPSQIAGSAAPLTCRPSGRTLAEFGELSAAEKTLVECCRRGKEALIAEARPKRRTKANQVRASLIRFLALGGDERAPVHEYGVALRGAWITDTLEIEDNTIPYSLSLIDCSIDGITAWRSSVPTIQLNGSHLRGGLQAQGIRSQFGISLGGIKSEGLIYLAGARLGGDLELGGATLTVPAGEESLNFGLAVIEGSVDLSAVKCTGAVVFDGAVIKGDLICEGGHFRATGGFALFFDGSQIGRNVFLHKGFHAKGGARLLGARIGLVLDCSDGRFVGWKSDQGIIALECERLTVGGAVFLVRSHFVGGVSFHNASIGAGLTCGGGRFKQADEIRAAIDCTSANISGQVDFSDGFVARGSVNLTGAAIRGNLNCTSGRFDHAPGSALVLEDASISLSARLSGGCHVTGSVALQSAEIGRDLMCSGGRFESQTVAIDGSNAEIGGDVQLGALLAAPGLIGAQFSATGEVNFRGASVGKNFNCRYGQFTLPPVDPDDASVTPGVALQLELAEIDDALIFQDVSLSGPVELRSARAGVLCDDLASWSGTKSHLVLDGFTYGRFAEGPVTSKERVAWLDYQKPDHLKDEFRPQPWDQVITALRASGHPIAARGLAIAKNDRRREAGKFVWGGRRLHWLYGRVVGYGYQPSRLLWVFAVVWLIFAAAYSAAARPWWGAKPFLSSSHESTASFDPFFYSADVLLPIVDFGYADEWKPVVSANGVQSWGWWLRILRGVEIVLGWLFGGALAAMLAQLIKKE